MFAQLMREMLTDQSFESFRAHTLDTIARLDEAIAVGEDVRLDRLPKLALEPVQSELAWSLSKDPVARDVAANEIALLVDSAKIQAADIGDFIRHVSFLRKRLGERYRELCEQKILALFSEERRRIELRQATGFYCSHLVNSGYSKSHLLRCTEDAFFSNSVHRAGRRNLTKFFRNFTGITRRFNVYATVVSDFGRYLSKLRFHVYSSAHQLPKKISDLVAEQLPLPNGHSYLIYSTSAHDEDGAVAEVENVFASVRALAFIVPHTMECEWQPAMYVAKPRSIRGVVRRSQALPLQRTLVPPSTARKALKSLTSYSAKVLSNFDNPSQRNEF